jgi:hypothetical protein
MEGLTVVFIPATGGSRKIRTGHERLFKLQNNVKIIKTNTLKYCARMKRQGQERSFNKNSSAGHKKFKEKTMRRQTNNKNNNHTINQR